MGCDMCGESKKLFVTLVEGVEMQLCDACKVYGEVKRSIPTEKEKKIMHTREVKREKAYQEQSLGVEMVVADYGRRIKEARERLGKKQEKFAKELAMKASQLHKHESGHQQPDMETARKLERALNITLVETYVEKHEGTKTSSGPLTIADLLKKSKKK